MTEAKRDRIRRAFRSRGTPATESLINRTTPIDETAAGFLSREWMEPADPLPANQAGHNCRTPLEQCGDIHPNPGPQLKCPYCGKKAGAGTIQCAVCGNWSHMRCVGVKKDQLPAIHICRECENQPWECQVCNKNWYF